MQHTAQYTIETIKDGQQPKPYAPHQWEYLITRKETQFGKEGLFPNLPAWGNDEELKGWAKKLVKAICINFRERNDNDGKTGMDAEFFPTLESIECDREAGSIRVKI